VARVALVGACAVTPRLVGGRGSASFVRPFQVHLLGAELPVPEQDEGAEESGATAATTLTTTPTADDIVTGTPTALTFWGTAPTSRA
jgi:hypothetical protein